jgi:hypothetical protein
MAMAYAIKLMTDSTSTAMALGLENSPLGMIDPEEKKSGGAESSNPIEVKTAEDGFKDGEQQAQFARAVEEQMILVEDTRKEKQDYWVFYSVDIKKQPGIT